MKRKKKVMARRKRLRNRRLLRARRKLRWCRRAFYAGMNRALLIRAEDDIYTFHRELNRIWNEWVERAVYRAVSWPEYWAVAASFVAGASRGSGKPLGNRILWSTLKPTAAIVTAMNEEATLGRVIGQLERLPFREIIVVVNGSSDRSFEEARKSGLVKIVHDPQPLGHDVGRAVGARLSRADILLFVDGDIEIEAEKLIPFVQAVDRGTDIVLNNITPYIGRFSEWDPVTMVKAFLNRALQQRHLVANSLTAIPHAISRNAITAIGTAVLAVPPLAQVKAVQQNLKVGAPYSVDVITHNRIRQLNTGLANPVAQMIIGDHMEALQTLMQERGVRLHYPDLVRQRHLVKGLKG